jgi:hypothetical protein
MDSSYPRAVLSAALQGLLTGAWVAAGELPVWNRRLVRVGSVAAISALASIGDKDEEAEEEEETAKERTAEFDKRKLAITGASLAIGIGMIAGRRQVEKRWLAALTRAGHVHPHRALGVRMGLLSFAGTLPGRLVKVHERRKGL